MHGGNNDATSQLQHQLEQQRMQQQQQSQRQAPFGGGDVSQLLSANAGMSAADVLQSQQMQSQQVLAYYWQLYLTNALQQAGGQLPLPYMPGNMLGAAPFQSQFLIQQQQQRDAMQQHQNQMPMQMQQQYPLSTPAPNMDPQHQLLQLQQLQQFQQLSQQSQQQQHHPSHLNKIKLQPNGSRELDDMAKRRSDDGVIAASSKKPRKIRNENKMCSNCGSNNTPFWRKDRNTGLPLCNACGLYYAKNDAMRPKVLWKAEDAPSSSPASSKHAGLQAAIMQRLATDSAPSSVGASSPAATSPTATLPPVMMQPAAVDAAVDNNTAPPGADVAAGPDHLTPIDHQTPMEDVGTQLSGKASPGDSTPLPSHLVAASVAASAQTTATSSTSSTAARSSGLPM